MTIFPQFNFPRELEIFIVKKLFSVQLRRMQSMILNLTSQHRQNRDHTRWGERTAYYCNRSSVRMQLDVVGGQESLIRDNLIGNLDFIYGGFFFCYLASLCKL